VRRHILGLLALASLVSALVIDNCPPLESYRAAGSMGLRIGMVLGVLWLAWPDLHRLPRWAWYVLPIGLFVLIRARVYLVFLLPPLAVATVLYLLYRKVRRSSSH
jgi:hypothetical protein